MDTGKPTRLSLEEYKRQIRMHWGSDPCGSNYSDKMFLTKEYFEEVERHRNASHPWIPKAIHGFDIEGKKVLEIGYGMGTDHLSMARRGAVMHGIDLTPMNYEVTRKRLEIFGMVSELSVGDAETLPFPDGYFDFVYSFGVIHHSPDTQGIVSEIRRVLAPGGKCFLTVYHERSVFFWWSVYLFNYLLRGGRKRRTLEQQLSLIEYPNTNENIVVRLFTRKGFAAMFRDFSGVDCSVKHLLPVDIAFFSRFFKNPYRPRPFLDRIGDRFGWYLIVEAVK
jgi:ubiquinone/menaquinone biosynthesis C-methylase UbiE